MPNHWLLKTEPGTFSWQDLVRDGRATWDGVKNPAALGHLRAMRPGDLAFVYHTGGEKSVVGICRVVSEPYPDPGAGDPRLVVVDIEPVKPLPQPVSLAAIKADRQFAGFSLVRIPRLSVMPVTPEQWRAILAMA
jgi:predicted RNA-binding protein with PUA-like domain